MYNNNCIESFNFVEYNIGSLFLDLPHRYDTRNVEK